MRYIGNKRNLVDDIEAFTRKHVPCADLKNGVFLDLLSGSNSVANHFKQFMPVITNDSMYFSYALAKGTTCLNALPDFGLLDEHTNQQEVMDYLNNIPDHQLTEGFIASNYTFHGSDRNYLSDVNGLRVDTIRTKIEDWYQQKLINEDGYYYLLASLLNAISKVSNIRGSYVSYLHDTDPRSQQSLSLNHPIILDNHRPNVAYHGDANKLIAEVQATVCYIDPPYAQHQYTSNYHLLETVCLYDSPKIKGKTGIREYDDSDKSRFCSTVFAYEALSGLIRDCQSPHVIISYTSRGIINPHAIKQALIKYCDPASIVVHKFNYHTHKGAKTKAGEKHYEYLYYAKKNIAANPVEVSSLVSTAPVHYQYRSPSQPVAALINYPEDQNAQLKAILSMLPTDVNEFVDVFSGGMAVALNVKADKVLVNDFKAPVIDMFEFVATSDISELLQAIDVRIKKYKLSRVNKKGYLKLRDYYNKNPNPIDLYLLISHSYNARFRFNSKGRFNAHFGQARVCFTERNKMDLIHYHQAANSQPYVFSSFHFKVLLSNTLVSNKALYYCHPPSLLLAHTYAETEAGFAVWKESDQHALYEMLDRINEGGGRFLLVGLARYQNARDNVLLDWSGKYSQAPVIGSDEHSDVIAVYNY